MLEGRRAAREQALDAFVAPLLQPGETVRTVFAGQSTTHWAWFSLPAYPLAFWSGWGAAALFLLACYAVVALFVLRYYWIVLTDRRVLAFSRRMWSQRGEMLEGPRQAGSPAFSGGRFTRHVTLEVDDRRLALDVARENKDRAAAAVAEAASRACPLVPGGDGGRVRWQVTHLSERDA